MQREKVYYLDTFSPILVPSSNRMIVTTALQRGWSSIVATVSRRLCTLILTGIFLCSLLRDIEIIAMVTWYAPIRLVWAALVSKYLQSTSCIEPVGVWSGGVRCRPVIIFRGVNRVRKKVIPVVRVYVDHLLVTDKPDKCKSLANDVIEPSRETCTVSIQH